MATASSPIPFFFAVQLIQFRNGTVTQVLKGSYRKHRFWVCSARDSGFLYRFGFSRFWLIGRV